jgi:hypothetical protein
MSVAKFSYYASGDVPKQGELAIEDYRRAADRGMSVSSYLSAKYPDADVHKYGSVFQQAQQSLGIYTKPLPEHGILATTVAQMLKGECQPMMAGASLAGGGTGIVAPSQQGTTPATRVFFPETVLQIMNETLYGNVDLESQVWASMLSGTETINTEMFTQPKINTSAPRAVDSSPIAQNTLPKTMVSVTTSETSKSIVTNSIGLQISDQALQRTSLDLLGIIFAQQAAGESQRNLWRDITAIKAGNLDSGDAALPVADFTDYDAAATTTNVTQKGWLKFLWDPTRAIQIDSIICDLDTFLAIQQRTGRPVIYDPNTGGASVGNVGTALMDVTPMQANVNIAEPRVLIVDTSVLGANIIMGFDSRFGIRQVINASANYSATEAMILQRSNFFRIDWGKMSYRLYDSAFRCTTIVY